MIELAGRNAVVTGASRGIGQAIATALASEGANVASLHLPDDKNAGQTKSAIESCGGQTLMLEGDVRDSEAVRQFGERVQSEFGGIDIWVNNAARLVVRPFLETSDAEFQDVLASNLMGYVYGCRAALAAMMPAGSGKIINVSSITDIQPISEMTAYVTAKAGVVGLTKSLAVEFAPYGITINCVAPGAVETPLTAEIYTPSVRKTYNERIAIGRVAKPEDIVGAVLFLASNASQYVCGHELVVDGGMTLNGNVGFAE